MEITMIYSVYDGKRGRRGTNKGLERWHLDWPSTDPSNLSLCMFVHSEMYNPQLYLYSSSHYNLPPTHHFEEMLSSRSTTTNPLASSADAAVSLTLSRLGWGPFGSPSSLAFATAASPCSPPTSTPFLWDLFCLPFTLPLWVVFTTVPSAAHSSSLYALTRWPHPGPWLH